MGHPTKPTDIGTNRTGIASSPLLAKKMIEGEQLFSPSGDLSVVDEERIALSKAAPPVGTMPPPLTVKGAAKAAIEALKGDHPMVLIDKLGERLAFERTGVRLYEALLAKLEAASVHEGGPSRIELERILAEELDHFRLVKQAIESLGADPTVVTPCADITATASTGLMQVLTDPRTTLTQALGAILIAELADNDGWRTLITLAEGFGKKDFVERFTQALAEEDEHVVLVREWLTRSLAGQAGIQIAATEAPGP